MGGGTAGDVNYPPHMMALHKEILYGAQGDGPSEGYMADFNVTKEIKKVASQGSPYAMVAGYGGVSQDLALPQRFLDQLADAISRVHPELDTDSILSKTMDLFQNSPIFDFRDVSINVDLENLAELATGRMEQGVYAEKTFDAEINAAIEAAEMRLNRQRNQAVARMAAGYANAGAIHGSAFLGAMVQLEDEHTTRLNEVATNLQIEGKRLNAQIHGARLEVGGWIMRSVLEAGTSLIGRENQVDTTRAQAYNAFAGLVMDAMNKSIAVNAANYQQATVTALEFATRKVQLHQDSVQFDIQLEAADALWNLELFQYANQAMASIAGASTYPQKTKFDRIVEAVGVGTSLLTGVGTLGLGIAMALCDIKVKKDIQPITTALRDLHLLRGVRFRYNDEYGFKPDRLRYGFIAQEVEKHFPDWVDKSQSDIKYIRFNPVEMFALLTEAIKALDERLARLEKRNG